MERTLLFIELKRYGCHIRLHNKDMTIRDLKKRLAYHTGLPEEQIKVDNFYFTDDELENECKVMDCLRTDILRNELQLMVFKLCNIPKQPNVDSTQNLMEGYLRSQGIKEINYPRRNKKLLVLDVDKTLYDANVFGTNLKLLGVRPHLHHFLKSAYEDYDIILWSDTDLQYLEQKVELMAITDSKEYKILGYFNKLAMLLTYTLRCGIFKTKALERIWALYPQFNEKNTIMCDDQRKNFHYNGANGLLVKTFHYADSSDYELLYLKRYLKWLANSTNISRINHNFIMNQHRY